MRLVLDTEDQYPTRTQAMRSIAGKLGIGSVESLRNWVRQAEVDAGAVPGVSTAESAEVKALKRENAELRRANETSHASWCQAAAA